MIREFSSKKAVISKKAYVDENAVIIGDVEIEENVSIWPSAVLRGDMNKIKIGKNSNVQDNATLHVTYEDGVEIGENVTIGHNAVVHGAKIGDNSLIGMGAIVLDKAVIGKNCLIGAGALVTPRTVIEDNSLVLGAPAKVVKKLDKKAVEAITKNAEEYVELANKYLEEKNDR
jgi:carbonic anhydrase/acetyltransferase-like protein (isoleucine patch superfamily)